MADRLTAKNIVCLGGGIGTSTLLRGLKKYQPRLTVVTSMVDDGGSSGRLRHAYGVMPPGDIVSCIAALIPEDDEELRSLLLYRFSGKDRSSKAIDGHKFGNLLMLAEIQRTGDFYKAIDVTKRMFHVDADFFPATEKRSHLWAITKDGRRIHSETALDVAHYSEPYGLKKVYITPSKPEVNPQIVKRLMSADVIVSGPGDLYTNQLPVLIVPQIRDALLKSKAKKIFVLNIANKPFETKGFTIDDFAQTFIDHLGVFPFDTIIANNNVSHAIPKKYPYAYIKPTSAQASLTRKIIQADVVDDAFPIYHDPKKLAQVFLQAV